jgi:hypothetical protein
VEEETQEVVVVDFVEDVVLHEEVEVVSPELVKEKLLLNHTDIRECLLSKVKKTCLVLSTWSQAKVSTGSQE